MSASAGRQLGAIEALLAVTRECPSGSVRTAAEYALQRIQQDPEADLAEQVYFIITATRGWQGERAHQVRSSLKAFLDLTATSQPDAG